MNLEDYINDMNMSEVISGSIKVLNEENEELQQRIDKAIEYIEKSCNHEYYYKYYGRLLKSEIKENVLEILKGSDEND